MDDNIIKFRLKPTHIKALKNLRDDGESIHQAAKRLLESVLDGTQQDTINSTQIGTQSLYTASTFDIDRLEAAIASTNQRLDHLDDEFNDRVDERSKHALGSVSEFVYERVNELRLEFEEKLQNAIADLQPASKPSVETTLSENETVKTKKPTVLDAIAIRHPDDHEMPDEEIEVVPVSHDDDDGSKVFKNKNHYLEAVDVASEIGTTVRNVNRMARVKLADKGFERVKDGSRVVYIRSPKPGDLKWGDKVDAVLEEF